MEEKDFIKIWKKGFEKSKNDKPITMETIENLVTFRSKNVTRKIRWDLYISLVCNIIGLVLTGYAAILYQPHQYLKWILPLLGLVIIPLLIQTLLLIAGQRKLKVLHTSLREKVSGIIRFHKGGYRLWQLFYPFGMMILVISVTLLVEYQEGMFRINHPFEFIVVMVLMYVLMYFPMRFTRNVYLQDLENCLENLDEQGYAEIGKKIRRHRIFILFFVIGLALLVLGSLVAWYYYSG